MKAHGPLNKLVYKVPDCINIQEWVNIKEGLLQTEQKIPLWELLFHVIINRGLNITLGKKKSELRCYR